MHVITIESILSLARAQVVVPVVTVGLNDTLGVVIERLVDNSIHRVYIADTDGVLIGMISIRDVLQAFLRCE